MLRNCYSLLTVLVMTGVASAQLTADLALVPNDSVLFSHLRVAEIWKHESMSDVRTYIAKAGPKAFATLEKDFYPPVSTIDRMTAFVLPLPKELRGMPTPIVVLAFNAPFDIDRVVKQFAPGSKKATVNRKTYYTADSNLAIYHPEPNLLVISDEDTMKSFLTKVEKDGPMKDSIAQAPKHSMTIACNITGLPMNPRFAENLPPDMQPLLKAQVASLTVDIANHPTFTLNAGFSSGNDAAKAEKSLRFLANVARKELEPARKQMETMIAGKGEGKPRSFEELTAATAGIAGLAAINTADELLADPPIKRSENQLSMTAMLKLNPTTLVSVAAVAAGLMVPAVSKVREASERTMTSSRMRELGTSLHQLESINDKLPSAAICDKAGKPLLSWRVTILPYIEQQQLYDKFKLDEPWDSEHNLKVYKDYPMPKMFEIPGTTNLKEKETHFQVFTGSESAFDISKGKSFKSFQDGLSNTALIVVAAKAVPWTKPADLEFDPKKDPRKLIRFDRGTTLVLFGDNHVAIVREQIGQDIWKAIITIAGGEVVTLD